jgi:hypothetical protein
MTNPATEAAERATNGPINGPIGAFALSAAREALKPIRELHQPQNAGDFDICGECQDGNEQWPCETAKLIYTREELS